MTMVIEQPALPRNDRLFFTGMACAAAITAFAGFAPTYFLRSAALFGVTDLFVAAVVAYDLLSRGRVHPATIFGGLLIVVFKPLLLIVAGTPPWLAFADALR